jgi:hypothetical protein
MVEETILGACIMMSLNDWSIKGVFYECCLMEGHCSLWFGRDLRNPCRNLITYQITEGNIMGLDMAGVYIMTQQDYIGPKFADLDKRKKEGAIYVSNSTTQEQRKILEPFTMMHMRADRWKKCLGVKFVKITFEQNNRTYHVTMPFGEQQITLTTGGDGKTPVRIENAAISFVTNVKAANGDFWNYHDYGKNLEFQNTSSVVADFCFSNK